MKQANKNKRWLKMLNKFKNDSLQCAADRQKNNMYILGRNEPTKALKAALNNGVDYNAVAQERDFLNFINSSQKTNY